MNFELTAVQKEIRSKARQFAQDEVAPLAKETDEARDIIGRE